jgi:hypothetical protein
MLCRHPASRIILVDGPDRAREEAERVTAVLVAGFFVLLKIAGYRFRLLSEDEESDHDGTSSEYPGVHTGTDLSHGSDGEKLSVDARRVTSRVFFSG